MLGGGLANARRNMVTVGLFSLAVNLLVFAIPVYLFNMSIAADQPQHGHAVDADHHRDRCDRGACADGHMRRIILMRIAVETEARLGGPVLSAAVGLIQCRQGN